MKCLFLLLLAVTLCYCDIVTDVLSEEWNLFKLEYGKQYESTEDEEYRMGIFLETRKKIAQHNAEYERGKTSFKLGINQFSDLLQEEFTQKMNGFNKAKKSVKKEGFMYITPANAVIPVGMDWRKKGAVTRVKDQGSCGACWAFSAVGALEGQNFRKTGTLTTLSEQQIIDCNKDGNGGCNGGGYIDLSFRYIRENGGINSAKSYPFEGKDGQCKYISKNKTAIVTGEIYIPAGNEKKLKDAVATIGPIAVAVDASSPLFQHYKTGIYYDEECNSQNANHGMLVVGYGVEKGTKLGYWLVKNSYGTKWGDNGYMKIRRNKGNHCGIASHASYPLV
ncbi:hypothetical protein L9F63_009317 [Diploptera punctata]|uniref:Cathepsin L n=1 Tax=Diploptera punctata TaxID=6984 RepID=A0AAD8ESF0_DIPPU|nr:hypothetical protein L9F63_009317 [Diploptera punctata]